jgi:hypothetical protein
MSSASIIRDLGDHEYTDAVIFNVCFVPDPNASGVPEYQTRLIEISTRLAKGKARADISADYLLAAAAPPDSTTLSLIHASLAQVIIPDPKNTWSDFADVIAPYIGRTQDFTIKGLTVWTGSPFDRLEQVSGGKHSRLAPGLIHRVVEAPIQPNRQLLALQKEIHSAITTIGDGSLRCLTPAGDDYTPHHTTYVERVPKTDASADHPALAWNMATQKQTVRHVLAFADCGPSGQVRRFETDPVKARELMRDLARA